MSARELNVFSSHPVVIFRCCLRCGHCHDESEDLETHVGVLNYGSGGFLVLEEVDCEKRVWCLNSIDELEAITSNECRSTNECAMKNAFSGNCGIYVVACPTYVSVFYNFQL